MISVLIVPGDQKYVGSFLLHDDVIYDDHQIRISYLIVG